ncbi:MAG: DoxX family membrane protein [Ignavibacteriae bacterium]|nr:DoxX family membrane protein [Ignavibacteriota bacterium]
MNKATIINYTIAIIRLYVALVFILSGLDKINDLSTFSDAIENYKLLPLTLVNIVSIIIPWIEVVAGTMLLLGIFIKENSIIIFSMLSIFTLAIFIALLKGLNIDCGCQGTSLGQQIGIWKLIENIALLIGTYLGIYFPRQKLTFLNSSRL